MIEIAVEKNEENELPIPHIWRPVFKEIVKSFVKGDYKLNDNLKNINSISEDTANQIKEYIEDYGEELVELPEETWKTSIYIHQGSYWSVLIDLFTKEEGLSDLVLNAEVRESNNDYVFTVNLIYIP